MHPAPASALESHATDRKRRVALAAGLALLWGIFTLLAQLSGALDALEEPLLDWRLSLDSVPAPPSEQIALIAIDNIPPTGPGPGRASITPSPCAASSITRPRASSSR